MKSGNVFKLILYLGIVLAIEVTLSVVAADSNFTAFDGRPNDSSYAIPEHVPPPTEAALITQSTETQGRTEDVNISKTSTFWKDTSRNVTIIVMGRSGSGVSSTILKLLGRDELRKLNEGYLVKEYLVPTSGTTFLKIVDVDGLVDGKTLEQDARILATLKSYLANQKNTLGEDPDIFLIISRFDDNRYIGSQSTFAQVVKRAQVLQTTLYDKTQQNNIFLMTRFMSETKVIQRRPKEKIKLLQETIANYSLFEPPIHVAVGENLAEPETINPEDGYTKLPNKEFYPKNVFNLMINLTRSHGSEGTAAILEAFRDNRLNYSVPTVTGFPNNTNSQDFEELLTLIQLTSFDIEETEVNLELLKAYESITDPNERQHIRNAIPMLQLHLQNSNIRLISQLPQRALDRVKFFQTLPPSLELATLKLLRKSINFLPEFVQPPLVGSSYDVTTDEALSVSPLKTDKLIASSVGYLLPSYIICSKFSAQAHQHQQTKNHLHSVDQLEDYVKRRIQDLHFPERDSHFNVSSFTGNVKVGFNLSPEPGVVPSVSTVREVRKFRFQLDTNYHHLSEEFLEESIAMNTLKLSDRDSVTEWKQYFSKFGTHVVSSAYVGGRIEGLVVDHKIQNLTSGEKNNLLREIVNFEQVVLENKPNYRFFGGERVSDLERIYQVSSESRSILLSEWSKSVSYDPIALDYELELIPLSQLLRDVNSTLGQEIESAANLLLSGNLVYKRVKNGRRSKPVKTSTPRSITDLQGEHSNGSRLPEPVLETVPNQFPSSLPTSEDKIPDSATNSNDETPFTTAPPTAKPRKPRKTTTYIPARIVPTPVFVPPNLGLTPESNYASYLSSIADKHSNNSKNMAEHIERVSHKNNVENISRETDDANREAARRQRLATEEEERLETKRRKIQTELESMKRQYEEQAESMRRITEEDMRRRQRQFEEELREIEQRRQQLLQSIAIIEAQNKQRAKEKACLKKGTLIVMADRSEKPVELVKVGDLILNHELQPVAVIGTLEKFLMTDSFHGFSEKGPFFFTDTHILVGPNDDNEGTQLLVHSLSELIAENPLMQNLNVKQFNRSGTNFLAYDKDQHETVVKSHIAFTDPVEHPPETLVHIIEVDSPVGTYFANGYVCRHELPPLELWPNTMKLLLDLSGYPEVQRIGTVEYAVQNVRRITEALEKIHERIIGVIHDYNGNENLKSINEPSSELDNQEILSQAFTQPMLSSFLMGLYGKAGVPISVILDNPEFLGPPKFAQSFRTPVIQIVLEEANAIQFV